MDIMYTSGTTGKPKAVVVRHHPDQRTGREVRWNGLGFMTASPFSTTSGALLIYGPMSGGMSGWYLPRFDADRWLSAVATRRPVVAFIVPAMAQLIVANPRFAEADLSSLAALTIGGAPIARGTLRRLGEQLPGTDILVGYGLTEFGAVTRTPSGDKDRHLGSAGRPLPGIEIRVVDQAGNRGGARRGGRDHRAGDGSSTRVLPGRGRQSADLAGRVAPQRRPRVGRRRRFPLDQRTVQGRHHPGRPQRGRPARSKRPCSPTRRWPRRWSPAFPMTCSERMWEPGSCCARTPTTTVSDLRAFLLERLADYKVPRAMQIVDVLPRNAAGKVVVGELDKPERPTDEPGPRRSDELAEPDRPGRTDRSGVPADPQPRGPPQPAHPPVHP